MLYWKKKIKYLEKQFVTTEPTKYGLRKKTFNGCLSLMLKKYEKIFCKQFVRIKKKLLTTEPTKYGLKFSVSVLVNQ